MVAFPRLSGGLAAAALGGAALLTAPGAALAASGQTVVVPCSTSALVSAINTANGSLSPTTLQLSPFCTYTIFTPAVSGDGLPKITNDITLAGGQNTVIRRGGAAPNFRLIEITGAGDLSVSKLSLLNGRTLVGNGGAIRDAGSLSVTNSRISGNTALNGGGVVVEPGASATISSTLMNLNAGLSVGGGAVLTSGFLRLFNTVLDSNSAKINGGALNVQGAGTAIALQATFTNNTSGGLGGGISNLGTLSLNGSQVRLNTGSGGGGIATGNNKVTLRSTIIKKNTPDNCSPMNTIPGCVG